MSHLQIICHESFAWRWEELIVEQLAAVGHLVSVRRIDAPARANERRLDLALRLGRRLSGSSLADRIAPFERSESGTPGLVLDLTGVAPRTAAPALTLELLGRRSLADGLAQMLAAQQLPELVARLDGTAVGRAAPMLENRFLLGRIGDAVLAAGVSLIVQTVSAFFTGRLRPIEAVNIPLRAAPNLTQAYLPTFVGGLFERVRQKVTGKRAGHWQVGYRIIEGPGIAETGRVDGPRFVVLPDDGKRFYADPFVFEHNGRRFLFVEELPYATRKGVISVAEMGADGHFGTPRAVIEEPHHLSYPQVFTADGEIFMLPESSGGRELVLYRALEFPDRWVRDTVLLADVKVADATLLQRDGRHWLIATRRLDYGSSADTMVVYSAPALRGPWAPHPLNPIVIDRAAARPGGSAVAHNGRIVLPVQDGSRSYGGGLGLMDLLRLDDDAVLWGPVRPIEPGNAWARQGFHTLNRAGQLEVVDSTG